VVRLVCVAFVVLTWAPLRIFIGVYCSAMHACTMYRLLRLAAPWARAGRWVTGGRRCEESKHPKEYRLSQLLTSAESATEGSGAERTASCRGSSAEVGRSARTTLSRGAQALQAISIVPGGLDAASKRRAGEE
jgi:hypothetical protein